MAVVEVTTQPKAKSAAPTADATYYTKCVNVVQSLLSGPFSEFANYPMVKGGPKMTLEDAKFSILGVISTECGFRPRQGRDVVFLKNSLVTIANPSSTGLRFWRSPAIVKKRLELGDLEMRNHGLTVAHGAMQVMGWNHIDLSPGADALTYSEIAWLRARHPQYAGVINSNSLLVPSDTNVSQVLYANASDPTIDITSGMCVLMAKLKKTGSMEAAIKAYLGNGKDVVTAISTSDYLRRTLDFASLIRGGKIPTTNSSNKPQYAANAEAQGSKAPFEPCAKKVT